MKSFIVLIAVTALISTNAIPLPKEESKETKLFGALGDMAGNLMPSTPSTLSLGMKAASFIVDMLSSGNPIEDAQRLYKLYTAYEAFMDFMHKINPTTYLPNPSDVMTDLENEAEELTNNLPNIPSDISSLIPELPKPKLFGALGDMAGNLMPSTPSTLSLGMKAASFIVSALSTGNPIEDAQRLYKLYTAYEAFMDFMHTINPTTYLPNASDMMTNLENEAGELIDNLPTIPASISNLIPELPKTKQFPSPQFPFPQSQRPQSPFQIPQIPSFPGFPAPPQGAQGQSQGQAPPMNVQDLIALISQFLPPQQPGQVPPAPPADANQAQTKFIPLNLPLFPLLENETFRKIICLLDGLNPFNGQTLDICLNDGENGDGADEEGSDGDAPADGGADDPAGGDDDPAAGDDDAAGDDADADDAAAADTADDPDADADKKPSADETEGKPKPKPSKGVPLTPERFEELMNLFKELTGGSGGGLIPGLPGLLG